MKLNELKLLAELMKNCNRSDRELARAIGVSQPTVSRMKAKLEKEGVVSEYTIIPDFRKIGYHLLALTFFSMKKSIVPSEMPNAIKMGVEKASKAAPNVIVIERGIGLRFDSFMMSFHKDYTSYTKLMQGVRTSQYLDLERVESFIVNLDDEVHYRSLTFATLAKHLLEMNEKQE